MNFTLRSAILFGLVVLFPNALALVRPVHAQDADSRGDYLAWQSDYRTKLEKLANRATTQNSTKLAVQIATWLPPLPTTGNVLFNPNDFSKKVGEAKASAEKEGGVELEFWNARMEAAEILFQLAEAEANAGNASRAVELLVATLHENPDHENARKLLGYENLDGAWMSDFEKKMKTQGHVWHEQFGWVSKGDVVKLESGLRPRGKTWISVEDDQKRRDLIQNGWILRTEHFQLQTNVGWEEGVILARRLETLHALWKQLFASCVVPKNRLQDAFSKKSAIPFPQKIHRVYYYRSRDEYNRALVRKQPKIEMTLGIYFDRDKKSHFFAGEDQHPATMDHEVTHQLFQESIRTSKLVGALDNFWIVEGIATYMESLVRVAGNEANGTLPYYTLGTPDAGRLAAAKINALENQYYVRLGEIVELGKNDLQSRQDLAQLYSQFAGLATFLMDEGANREALLEYLDQVYNGLDKPDSLSKLTEKSLETLDEEYQAFLKSLPADARE